MIASSALVHPTRSGRRLSSDLGRASPEAIAVHTWFFLSCPHLEQRYVPVPPPPPPLGAPAACASDGSPESERTRPEASASLSRL